MKNFCKLNITQSSKELKRILLLSILAIVGIIIISTSINAADNIKSGINGKESNITPKSATTTYEPYAYYQSFTTEYNVDEIIGYGGDSTGNGYFHINGATLWLGASSTTRARLNFGYNNPYYQTHGPPISYGVRATVRYRNWNDVGGSVTLYVQKDNGDWQSIWSKNDLNEVDRTWDIIWASSSSDFYRNDGSMSFRLVGSSYTTSFGTQPSCRVDIHDLRVRVNYEPHAYYQSFTTEYNVDEILAHGGDNRGHGYFHINGATLWLGASSTTRARVNLGFTNPYYYDYSLPSSYEVKCTIRYRNWNDAGGSLTLYVQKDNGDWQSIWTRSNLNGVDRTWDVLWVSDSPDYYRSNGYMGFKLVGSSYTTSFGTQPSCRVDIYNLRVELNYAPAVIAGNDQIVNEGDIVVFSGSFSDPGADDTHTITWDFGDGSTASGTLIPFHQYLDNGEYTVTLTVADSQGNQASDSLIVTVRNVAPIISELSITSVGEGTPCTLSGKIIDPSPLDTFTISIHWGDGNNKVVNFPAGTTTFNIEHKYFDDGVYIVALLLGDDDGGVDLDTISVYIYNLAPTLRGLGVTSVDEGSISTLTGFINDPGLLDSFTLTVDWGDGSIETFDYGAVFIPITETHRYFDNGIYIVSLTIEDDDGGVNHYSIMAKIYNVAPTADAGDDQTVDEGQTVFFTGTFTDPGVDDTHTFLWDFGDGFTASGTLTPTHAYNDNGIYTVTLTVTDNDGGVGIDALFVTVNNVAPIADAGLGQTVNEGQTVFFFGTFTDPGADDTHTFLWDFGDGFTTSGTITPNHAYNDNGIYTVSLTVTDDDGGVGFDTLTVIVYNVAPSVNAGPNQIINQDDTAFFSGTFTDPGADDTHTFLWDFGDGFTASGTITPTHVYTKYGTFTVTFTVTDDDGGVGSDTLIIEVRDVTDPKTTIYYDIYYGEEQPYYVSVITQFTLTAQDNPFGSGIDIIQYQIDSDGWITYTGPFSVDTKGSHVISYRSIDKAGNDEDAKSLDVIVNAVELTYIGDINGFYSDPALLEAVLIDVATQLPIEGKTIEFTIESQTTSALTGPNGHASVYLTLNQPSGDYMVFASFVEDFEYLGSSDSTPFLIEKEFVYAEYTGDTVVSTNADTLTLRATIFEDNDGYLGDLTYIFITISIYSENFELIESYVVQAEFTNIDGVGVATTEIPKTLIEGAYLIQISIDPDNNDYYCGNPSDYFTLIIYEPTGDFVTGGGWIWDSDGNKGNFGFNVKYKKNGFPKGQAIYVYREDGYVFIVKANAWIGMGINPENNYSIFQAKCNVKKVDPITGEILWEEGNYQLIIEVWDNNDNGGDDIIQVQVFDKIGIVFHEAGLDPYGILQGGNIVIHIDEKKK